MPSCKPKSPCKLRPLRISLTVDINDKRRRPLYVGADERRGITWALPGLGARTLIPLNLIRLTRICLLSLLLVPNAITRSWNYRRS